MVATASLTEGFTTSHQHTSTATRNDQVSDVEILFQTFDSLVMDVADEP